MIWPLKQVNFLFQEGRQKNGDISYIEQHNTLVIHVKSEKNNVKVSTVIKYKFGELLLRGFAPPKHEM